MVLRIMPALLLQKASKNSKSRNHFKEHLKSGRKEIQINFIRGKNNSRSAESDGGPNDAVKISKKFKL